jgi:hypothetical protein
MSEARLAATPVAIGNESTGDFVTRARAQGSSSQNPFLIASVSSVEGSDLASGLPQLTLARDPKDRRVSLGRLVTSADVGTTNGVGRPGLSTSLISA